MPPEATPAPANETAARTETGEIKDVQTPAPKVEIIEPPKTPTTETKPPSTEKTDGTEKPSLANEKPKVTEGAPEKYEAFKVPEGFELPEETSKEITGLFKDLNLTQDQGQKLVDYYTKTSQEALDAPFKLWQETQEKWVADVKADPEVGPKLDAVKTTISKAIDGLGDTKLAAEFRSAMDYTGAGNNLAFIKTFWKLAQVVTEGAHVAGRGPSPEGQRAPGAPPPDAAHALYPNLR